MWEGAGDRRNYLHNRNILFFISKENFFENISFAYYIFSPHLFLSAQDTFSICSLAKALRKN